MTARVIKKVADCCRTRGTHYVDQGVRGTGCRDIFISVSLLFPACGFYSRPLAVAFFMRLHTFFLFACLVFVLFILFILLAKLSDVVVSLQFLGQQRVKVMRIHKVQRFA